MPFQVVRHPRGPFAGTRTFATLGLSRTELISERSGKRIRQELVLAVPEALRDCPWPGLLQEIATELLADGRALLRGEVIGPRGPLYRGSEMQALYASVPVYFPDSFHQCSTDDGDVAVVWLIPISRREEEYVRAHGWSAFEDRLVEQDPDLTDVQRPSLVL